MILLNDLTAQYAQIKDEIEGAVARVLASGHYVLGPEVEAFKDEFARFCQTTHAVGVNSATCLRGAQPQRDRLAETLDTSGFAARATYRKPTHLRSEYAYLGYEDGAFPHAEETARELVSLPT